MTREETKRRIDALGPWFHNLEIEGVMTAPDHFLGDYPRVKFRAFEHVLPDLSGRTVLDVGCNAGFYSLEMKRRGAARVVAIDTDPVYLAQARFAARAAELEIGLLEMDVYDVPSLEEQFDLVIFMGVLYHLRHPLLALDAVREVTGDTLLFQSMQRGSPDVASAPDDATFWERDHFDAPGYPKLHFVEKKYAHDETNWWIPNRACVEAMLRSAGFRICAHPEEEVYLCALDEEVAR